MISFRSQVSGLELPILAELLLDIEQPDLAVRSSVPVRIGVGVGRRYVGDGAAGHRVAPVDGGLAGSPTPRGCGDTPGQVAGHVEPAVRGVIVVIHAKTRTDDPCTVRREGNAQARREVAVRGLHERIGEMAVGALRRRIDRVFTGVDPADVHSLIRVSAGALASKEGPLALRLRPRNEGANGRVVGLQIHDELIAQGVAPGRSQLIAEAGRHGELGRELIVIVEVGGFDVALVIGLRDLHRIDRGVKLAEEEVGERGAGSLHQFPRRRWPERWRWPGW